MWGACHKSDLPGSWRIYTPALTQPVSSECQYGIFKNHADMAASARRGNRTHEKPFGPPLPQVGLEMTLCRYVWVWIYTRDTVGLVS